MVFSIGIFLNPLPHPSRQAMNVFVQSLVRFLHFNIFQPFIVVLVAFEDLFTFIDDGFF